MRRCHYIIVRNDLPLGVLTAQLTHAAGESSFLYKNDSIFKGATAVVLEVEGELALYKAAQHLRESGIAHVLIVENWIPYSGQLMALGVVPKEKADIEHAFKGFNLLRTCVSPVLVKICVPNTQVDNSNGPVVGSEIPNDNQDQISTPTPNVGDKGNVVLNCALPQIAGSLGGGSSR